MNLPPGDSDISLIPMRCEDAAVRCVGEGGVSVCLEGFILSAH